MFDLDKILNNIIYSKTVSCVVGNPILVSVIIVSIILIIILFMFKKPEYEDDDDEDDSDETFWKKLVKVGIYMLIPVLTIIVVHYKNLEKEMESKYENQATDRIISETLQTVNAAAEITPADNIKVPPPSMVPGEGFSGGDTDPYQDIIVPALVAKKTLKTEL
jgi:hypothetical protein